MPVLLALASALLWGTADFLGGTAARRRAALAVVGGSQLVSLVAVGVAVLALGSTAGTSAVLVPGVLAGVVSLVALGSFYAALAGGQMGVVAAVSALGVLVPVAVGLVAGDRPAPVQVAGMAVAVVGAVLASGPQLRARGSARRPLLLAVVAAVGFGLVQVLVAEGSEHNVAMTLVLMRATTVTLLVVLALRLRTVGGLGRPDVPILTAIGVADVGANYCYGVATQEGLLSVVSVLGSLYPAVTVVLARVLHRERLLRVQTVGISAALAGVALIGFGSA